MFRLQKLVPDGWGHESSHETIEAAVVAGRLEWSHQQGTYRVISEELDMICLINHFGISWMNGYEDKALTCTTGE